MDILKAATGYQELIEGRFSSPQSLTERLQPVDAFPDLKAVCLKRDIGIRVDEILPICDGEQGHV